MKPQSQVEFIPPARREFAALPASAQQRIAVVITNLAQNPRPTGAVTIQGKRSYLRIRVGEHRVVYHVDDSQQIVTIVVVAHRSRVYRVMIRRIP